MEIFEGSLVLWDALDLATSSSRWRFFVPVVFGAAGGLAVCFFGDGSTAFGVAGVATLLAGVGIGTVWQLRWKSRRPVVSVDSHVTS